MSRRVAEVLVAETEVSAAAGVRSWPISGDFANAARDELLGFSDDRLEAARTEFAAEVGNDAEGARVVAALGDFEVGGCAGCG